MANLTYFKKFETKSDYDNYINSGSPVLPNVSIVSGSDVYFKDDATPAGPDANGHDYVDLGLPSGKLWATMNIGATSPEDYGNYYAWGELATKSDYSWNTYRFGSASPFTKYDQDGLTTLELVDDVARTEWGGDWRMPTEADLIELTANTTSVWDSTRSGRTLTSTVNGNSIFIPAAGYCNGTSRGNVGTGCLMWSSSLDPNRHNYAIYLGFSSGYIGMNSYARCRGFSVRGVLY